MKTIKSVLEQLFMYGVGAAHMDDIEDADERDKALLNAQKNLTIEALSDIESIIKEQVIGEHEDEFHWSKDYDPRNDSDLDKTSMDRNNLRNEQNKALLKALGKGEK